MPTEALLFIGDESEFVTGAGGPEYGFGFRPASDAHLGGFTLAVDRCEFSAGCEITGAEAFAAVAEHGAFFETEGVGVGLDGFQGARRHWRDGGLVYQ